MGMEALVLRRVTRCHPLQAGPEKERPTARVGHRVALKIATTLVRRGIKKSPKLGDREEEGGW